MKISASILTFIQSVLLLPGIVTATYQYSNAQSDFDGPSGYVIPAPREIISNPDEGVFNWELTSIVALPEESGKSAMKAYSSWLQKRSWPEELLESFGPAPTISGEVDASVSGEEAYILEVGRKGASIRASHEKGFFYGMQTLLQLIEQNLKGNRSSIPAVTVEDAPAFSWRGMHLDVCRHFFPMDSVKKYIDWMSRYKMNVFHWHLTEDQGWRIEIPDHPLLQEVSAWRDETLVGHYSEQPHRFDGKEYGGYYTREEIKELINYARDRQITVVPEIEMPGHARAALAAYPHLSCDGDSLPVATKWGVFEEVYCTKEATFDFLFDVLEDVIEIFPGEYIHIGGDECPKTKWKTCPVCQENIDRHELADEHELQSWFIGRIDSFLNARGKTLIGWDEILEGGLSDNAAVMSWRGTRGAVEAARQGHPVVLCPTSHAYFDYYQSEDPREPLAIGGYLPLNKVYQLDPVPEELKKNGSEWVLGAQGNVWTEYMPDYDHVEYMAFPRMLAMAEVVWSGESKPGFNDFAQRVVRHFPVLKSAGVQYGTQILEPRGWVELQNGKLFFHAEKFMDSGQILFSFVKNGKAGKSRKYRKPIRIKKSRKIEYRLELEDGAGPAQTMIIDPGPESKAKVSGDLPSRTYSGSGFKTLINGVAPPVLRHGGDEWLGWWGGTPEILMEWDRPVRAERLKFQFYRSEGSWIHLPTELKIEVNGKPFAGKIETDKGKGNTWWYTFSDLGTRKINSVKLEMTPVNPIPSKSQGAGHPAWIFLGQVKVE